MPYYPFMVKLNRCNGSFNTLDDSSSKICLVNTTEDMGYKKEKWIKKIYKSYIMWT